MNKNVLQSEYWHARFVAQETWTYSLRQFLLSKLALPKNPIILEVGSGTGAIISKMGQFSANIYGLDLNFSHLRFSQREFPEIPLACADGGKLPYSGDLFNIVFCHYLLLWVENPVLIVREMVRVTKTGGYVILFAEPDYGSRIDYPTALETLGKAQTDALRHQGADPLIGRKLKEIAVSSGLVDFDSGILGNESDNTFALPYWESEWQMYQHDLAERFTPRQLAYYKKLDLDAYRQGIRIQFVPTFYLYGKVP